MDPVSEKPDSPEKSKIAHRGVKESFSTREDRGTTSIKAGVDGAETRRRGVRESGRLSRTEGRGPMGSSGVGGETWSPGECMGRGPRGSATEKATGTGAATATGEPGRRLVRGPSRTGIGSSGRDVAPRSRRLASGKTQSPCKLRPPACPATSSGALVVLGRGRGRAGAGRAAGAVSA